MKTKYRHTKIIFTIGPATESEEVLKELIRSGADICRLNMAHASDEWCTEVAKRVKKIGEQVGKDIALMMDIKGPEIRTSKIEGMWELVPGEKLDIVMHGNSESKEVIRTISVNYPEMTEALKEGDIILVDSGLLHLKVLEKRPGSIRTEVVIGGKLGSKRHINLPGIKINLPALTEQDKEHIKIGVKANMAFFALSFVREAKDVEDLKQYLKECNSNARVIAKIEDQSGLKNLDAIIEASDGVMVARGDLGVECPFEQIPIIQKMIVDKCILYGKPVIIATHLLESMTYAPIPTRAEVSDVAQAIYEQADAVMLSGETSVGRYPVQCIETIKRVVTHVESIMPKKHNEGALILSGKNKMIKSAVVLAQEIGNTGIVVFTRRGESIQKLSSLRPTRCPLYVFTDDHLLSVQLKLLWGVEPFYIEFFNDRNRTIEEALKLLKGRQYVVKDDYLIILTNILVNKKSIDTIQLRKVE